MLHASQENARNRCRFYYSTLELPLSFPVLAVSKKKKKIHTQTELKVLIKVFFSEVQDNWFHPPHPPLGTLMTSTTDTGFCLFRNNSSIRADCTCKI